MLLAEKLSQSLSRTAPGANMKVLKSTLLLAAMALPATSFTLLTVRDREVPSVCLEVVRITLLSPAVPAAAYNFAALTVVPPEIE